MVRIVVNGQELKAFTVDNISLIYNAVTSTFGFSSINDYAPSYLSYPKIKIYHNDELIITGTIINDSRKSSSKPELVSISGYSTTGILEDCTIPVSAMPMQLDNMSIKDICEKILPLFNINYSYENSVSTLFNAKIEKTNFDYDKSIKSLIVDLCTEKGIYVNHTATGELRFTDSSASNLSVVKHFEDDGLIDMSIDVNGQQMHSAITVLSQTSDTNIAQGEYTINNPYCTVNRPIIYKMQNGDSNDVSKYARMKLSSELRSISLKITTTTFIKPGNLITVTSEKLRLKNRVKFFVEQTDITATKTGFSYAMTCVLKDVYTNNTVYNEFR